MTQIDLTQILKDCPEGTKLYSPLFGVVTFLEISDTPPRIVKVKDNKHVCWHFKKDGKYYNIEESECLLFPSKDCLDWSTFKVEQPKPEPKFKPFDRVLVRDGDYECWRIDFFDHYNQSGNFPYRCMTRGYLRYCIPYEGNEHLNRTTDLPKGW